MPGILREENRKAQRATRRETPPALAPPLFPTPHRSQTIRAVKRLGGQQKAWRKEKTTEDEPVANSLFASFDSAAQTNLRGGPTTPQRIDYADRHDSSDPAGSSPLSEAADDHDRQSLRKGKVSRILKSKASADGKPDPVRYT